LYGSILEPGKTVIHDLAVGRHGWIQLVDGNLTANGEQLKPGDGAAISGESEVEIASTGDTEAEFLFFELA
jgi:redox-sensitive bicupin YhaK (pirin superfamily)